MLLMIYSSRQDFESTTSFRADEHTGSEKVGNKRNSFCQVRSIDNIRCMHTFLTTIHCDYRTLVAVSFEQIKMFSVLEIHVKTVVRNIPYHYVLRQQIVKVLCSPHEGKWSFN